MSNEMLDNSKNGFKSDVWLKRLSDSTLSKEELARIIASDLRFVHQLGIDFGRQAKWPEQQ